MAVAWISATALYGVSTTYMGKLGTTIGYLAYGSFTILFANLLGWKTGEWTNAPPSALRSLWGATGLVLGGVGVLGLVSC